MSASAESPASGGAPRDPAAEDLDGTDGPDGRASRLEAVRSRVVEAARRVGRSPSAITLVAVSKAFGADAVREVRAAGHVDFGESRAQELAAKADELGPGIRWHFVGRLQTNKVKEVVGRASLIHSVDRERLARGISERARALDRVQPVLVQVNVGDDPAKAGVAPHELRETVARVREMTGLACQGLMTIPPLEADPRPLFARLRELRDEVKGSFPEVQHLSMGMTGDYETAVEEGATIVRVGEAIFGPRPGAA
ncbi:YggS family pyridoxal phosphate-dependent enzyme [Egibacter rhizosphaerae]|uniref:Pyridoxal phosphate homeostasis protein n=1 Tax=Egibacter rhizosphaerae TaxID=1670831 RepID=A0A411YAB7_9ACTN|nr:YggS family pyridoxal phosphate-dependent enzyme [Egibacter rhizosphaerae]QBI18128.1 YggS family pyridoxal phosphate-dependent enzyme [Egibacter rhizosphaerae]